MPRYPCQLSAIVAEGARRSSALRSTGRTAGSSRPRRRRRLCASQAPAARGSTVPVAAVRERLAQRRIEQDPRPFGADRELDLAVAALGADVEPAAADQRIAGEQREVEQQLDRVLGQLVVARRPSRARSAARRRTAPRARPRLRGCRSPRRTRRPRRTPGGRTSACWPRPARCRRAARGISRASRGRSRRQAARCRC